MSDEIKEIFIRMNDLIEHQFDKEYHTKCDLFKDIQGLLDYITNLQQKYEKADYDRHKLFEEKNRLNNIINYIWQVFENGGFEDGCDCIEIYDYLKELKENNNE